jgi:histidyl-tRNA synthetase
MIYANDKKIPYVILAGEEEITKNQFTVKNMKTGDQQKVGIKQLVEFLIK